MRPFFALSPSRFRLLLRRRQGVALELGDAVAQLRRPLELQVRRRRARHGPNEQCAEPFDHTELERVLARPDCGERMDAHPFSGGGNALVDACESCNPIWLDAGELAIIERDVPHVHHIEPVHTLPGAERPPGGVLGVLLAGRRRGLLGELFD